MRVAHFLSAPSSRLMGAMLCLLLGVRSPGVAAAQAPTPEPATQQPWIDLHLTGEALNAARSNANISLLTQRDDHSVFLMMKQGQGARMFSAIGNSVAVIGPAEIQMGNLRGIKTYSAGPGEPAICIATQVSLDCEIGRLAQPGQGGTTAR